MTAAQAAVLAATAEVWVGGQREGTAVLVDGEHLLTAAHVVKRAIEDPSVTVAVVFPGRSGELGVDLVPLPEGHGVDVAVLQMGEGAIAPARPVRVAAGRRLPTRVKVFGFPRAEQQSSGVWRQFTVSGPTTVGLVQMDWDDVGTLPGHSGGPVIDDSGRLVGILVQGSKAGRFDRFLPLTVVESVWSGLPRPWLYAGLDARGHVEQRATGQRGEVRGADLFQGREAALAKIRAWVTSEESPWLPLVVTGQPGAGKSAVLAHAALTAEQELGDLSGVSGLVLHARNAIAADIVEAVAGATGIDTPTDVAGLVRVVAQADDQPRLMVMMDALDEVASAADRMAIASLLAEMARLPWARVVVATRPLAGGDRFGYGQLLPSLGVQAASSINLVDLDVDPYADRTALVRYAGSLLAQEGVAHPGPPAAAWSAFRADPHLRERLAAAVAVRADGNFLVGAFAADLLSRRPQPVDPDTPGFDAGEIPSTVDEALQKYFNTLPAGVKVHVKGLLTGLAFAHGAGVNDKLWLAFARKFRYTVGQEDLDFLRDIPASDFLLTTRSDDTVRVTRLFHQALIDQLLESKDRTDHEAVYRALLKHVRKGGGWAKSPYASMHAAEHALDAGTLPELLDDLDYLASADMGRLAAIIEEQDPADRAPTAVVVRACTSRAPGLSKDERLTLLALSAAHLGLSDIRAQINRHNAQGVQVRWAHSRGTPHRSLPGHTNPVSALAFGTGLDGRPFFASGSWDGTVRVCDPTTGESIGPPLEDHSGALVTALAFGTGLGGRPVLASASSDRVVRLWDPTTGKPIGAPIEDHGGALVTALAFGTGLGGRPLLASACMDGTVRLWDPITGEHIGAPLEGHTGEVTAVAFGTGLGGRSLLASASMDGTVRLWDPITGKPIGAPLAGHTGRVKSVAFGAEPDARLLVASPAGDDRTVRLLDPTTGKPIGAPLEGHTDDVTAVAFGAGRDARPLLASGGLHGTVLLWDSTAGDDFGAPLAGHTDRVPAVAFGTYANGRSLLASGGDDRTVRRWDPTTGQPVGAPLAGHTDLVRSVAFGVDPDHRLWLASASWDKTVRLWDPATGESIGDPLEGHTDRVMSVAFGAGPNHELWLASASADTTVRLWDPITGEPIGDPLEGHTNLVTAVAFGTDRDGRPMLASGGWDHTVRRWDPTTGKAIGAPLEGHLTVTAVAFGNGNNGRPMLASAGHDRTVRLWDTTTGEPISDPLKGHTQTVIAVAFGTGNDGRTLLASASLDGTVRLWDPAAGAATATINLLDQGLSLATNATEIYAATGRTLVSLSLSHEQPTHPRN